MQKMFASVTIGLALGAVSAVSALDMRVGASLFYAGDYGGGFWGLSANGSEYREYNSYYEWEMTETAPWSGFGISGFFDLTYAEISFGLTFGGGKPTGEGWEYVDGYFENMNADIYYRGTSFSFTSLNIGILGKYPIALTNNITSFPAIGLEYAQVVSSEAKEGRRTFKLDGKHNIVNAGDFSALWVKFGGGLDYNINDRIFIRSELLYGIRLANKIERLDSDGYFTEFYDDLVNSLDDYDENVYYEPVLGHGLNIKVGLGYKF